MLTRNNCVIVQNVVNERWFNFKNYHIAIIITGVSYTFMDVVFKENSREDRVGENISRRV